MLFLSLLSSLSEAQQRKASDFEGEFIHRHSLHMKVENETIHNVEDLVKIRALNDKEAQLMVETYTHNFHSCQLVGKAQINGRDLVFKSNVSKELNRGKKAQCLLKVSLVENGDSSQKTVKIEDQDDLCKLKFCGMRAELAGEFNQRPPLEVKEKN